ncbi:LPXTG-motif cell wall anchor domain-containing protein [Actinomadura verrucosospora]|uniref:LPXTG-motif cell wall anchor domain-containing protein n=1 Tax=Actinomadura verrucosospora TaxID=46165 RepID=A0A7D3ZZA1_ACTVE|nr:LPXTG-motif cell wall anchor domain-containing protein [Actinomadura verrucosospora]
MSAAAAVAPVVAPARAARAVERRAGRDRAWSGPAQELADRLDLGALAGDIAARDVPLLLVGGGRDRVVPAGEVTAFRDVLQRRGAGAVETATFRMGHALAAEPGTEPRPPITDAVRVDGLLTDWFRERLADVRAEPDQDAVPADAVPADAVPADAVPGDSAHADPESVDAEPVDTTAVDTAPYPAPARAAR